MQIKTVGVLGAGQMGLGIAQAAARAGFETIVAKATPEKFLATRVLELCGSGEEGTTGQTVLIEGVGTR